MISLLTTLILAHFIGDFVLQPTSWVTDKQTKKWASKYLYYHIATHALCLLILLQFNVHYIGAIIGISVSHYIIDLTKLLLHNKLNSRWLFALDQVAHLAIILLTVHYYFPLQIEFNHIFNSKTQLVLTCIVFVTQVSSVIMKVIISKWSLESESEASLKDAGAYIGMLERLFVFAFIAINYWEGIGFLIAAKSVFRFGDLSKAKDRKLTEYILIGTLLSFGLAISCGLVFNYLMPQL